MNRLKSINCESCKSSMDGIEDILNTSFFDEIFKKNADGSRSLVAKIEIDMKSIIMLVGGISIAGIIIKRL